MTMTSSICMQVREERANHIQVIEAIRNKKLYDQNVQFVDEAIKNPGREEYLLLINSIKKDVFGNNNVKAMEIDKTEKVSKDIYLQT
jgi:hypothetical protein